MPIQEAENDLCSICRAEITEDAEDGGFWVEITENDLCTICSICGHCFHEICIKTYAKQLEKKLSD